MTIVEYADRDMAAMAVADRLAGDLKSALLTHEWVSFAVPGGSTPGPIFDALCASSLDWDRVHIFATDERWVAADDPRSNEGLIRARLLTERAAAAMLISLLAPAEVPEQAVSEVSARLAPELPISVLLLGMGADMHTASLFPGVAGLAEALQSDAPAVVAMRPDTAPEPRISLSAPALDGALAKHLVIFGDDKREALERARSLPPEEAPVQAVLSETTVHWAA